MNARHIHIATLIAASVALVLGTGVAAEDSPHWGQLQWAGYTFFTALFGALMNRAAALLAKE